MNTKKKTIKEKDDQKEEVVQNKELNVPDDAPTPAEGEKEELNPAGNRDNRPEEQTDGE